jgi:hypothetical protein
MWFRILADYLAIGCLVTLGYLAVWVRNQPLHRDEFWICFAFVFVWPIALVGSTIVFFQENLRGFWGIFRRRSHAPEERTESLAELIQTWLVTRREMNDFFGEEDPIEDQSRELAETILEQDSKRRINRWVDTTIGTESPETER